MKSLLKSIVHAAIGGISTGLAAIPAGAALTAGNILLPALGSALSSVISLFIPKPTSAAQGAGHAALGAIGGGAPALAMGEPTLALIAAGISAASSLVSAYSKPPVD